MLRLYLSSCLEQAKNKINAIVAIGGGEPLKDADGRKKPSVSFLLPLTASEVSFW